MNDLRDPKLQLIAALICLTVLFSFVLRRLQSSMRKRAEASSHEHKGAFGGN